MVGTGATAFSTILNAGGATASSCGLALGTNIPATFAYQTTNPSTNQATGTLNTPVNIAVGSGQSYVFAITPTAAFNATDVVINANCSNANPGPVITGVTTLLLSASNTPVPDIVALAATTSHDGIANIPGANGTGAFSVASVNVGSSSSITVAADTGSASLPVSINLCQTNSSAQCTSPLAPTVTTTINANATPTFSVFVTGSANVPFDPGNNRVFVRFKDSAGVVRGATSVAVRTQ